MPLTGTAALVTGTTYFVVVTSFAAAPNNCGTFTLAANGAVPVELQGFSVE